MGRFVSATGQFLLATYEQFSRPPTGSSRCPLTACRKHLPKFMVPRLIMIIEAMPLNPTRKNDSAHAESLPSVG
jgi:hypothetical protein